MNQIGFLLPEIFLAIAAMVMLLVGAWRGDKGFAMVMVLGLAAFAGAGFMIASCDAQGLAMNNMVAFDDFRRFAKLLVLIAAGWSLGVALPCIGRIEAQRPEYAVLVVLATLGMMLMISAHNLISVYVGLELQNLALYVLAAYRRDDLRSHEAGLKYFTLGALSSAILLFGLSLVYGFGGSLDFAELAQASTASVAPAAGFVVGVAFVLAGFAFKISAVPFHMWTPDVYEGAPTSVTAFLTAAPKVAALSLLASVLIQPFGGVAFVWKPVIMGLSVASMVVGSIGGLLQTNVKRLMAYSAIANVGTMLIGLAAFQKGSQIGVDSVQGLLLYLCFYAAGTLGVFGALVVLRYHGKMIETTDDLAGLANAHPVMAMIIAASLFSLAGVPPLAGFFGKYLVLLAAVKGGLMWLAILGVVTSVLAAGYYLRLIKVMYFDARKGLPLDAVSEKIIAGFGGLAALAVVAFIVFPSPLIEQARRAAESIIQ